MRRALIITLIIAIFAPFLASAHDVDNWFMPGKQYIRNDNDEIWVRNDGDRLYYECHYRATDGSWAGWRLSNGDGQYPTCGDSFTTTLEKIIWIPDPYLPHGVNVELNWRWPHKNLDEYLASEWGQNFLSIRDVEKRLESRTDPFYVALEGDRYLQLSPEVVRDQIYLARHGLIWKEDFYELAETLWQIMPGARVEPIDRIRTLAEMHDWTYYYMMDLLMFDHSKWRLMDGRS